MLLDIIIILLLAKILQIYTYYLALFIGNDNYLLINYCYIQFVFYTSFIPLISSHNYIYLRTKNHKKEQYEPKNFK